jgi:hypothetical protein
MRNPPAVPFALNCPRIEPRPKEALMRGHVRKRRTWEFIVDVGHHPDTGRRRQKSKGGFATRKEAESALHEFIRYVEGGGDLCPERIELGRVRRASTRVARRSLVWRSHLDLVVHEKENAGHLDLLGISCIVFARTTASLNSAERAKLAPQVLELAEAFSQLAAGLDERAVRQHAADRVLAVAVEISADDEHRGSAFATAVMSVRMVAADPMAFAGVEPDAAVAAVHDGIQSRPVLAPPEVAGSPFNWRRRLRRFRRRV